MTTIDFSGYPKEKRDLTDSAQNQRVLDLASQILDSNSDIIEIEDKLFRDSDFVKRTSPVLLEAIKCAASKKQLMHCNEKIHCSIIFAMYSETLRLQPKEHNEHGEDCLRVKVNQLNWLAKGLENHFTWNITAVDDGCTQTPSSSDVALDIISKENYGNVKVLKLEDAIESLAVCPGFTDLETTKDSRKGGAIAYGIWEAQHFSLPESTKHIIIYTDADLSSNLGQSGSLIYPIVKEGKKASIAHRYGIEKAVLVKENQTTTEPESTKNQPGKLIILLRHYARVSLLPLLEHIQDTQAGFKAFSAPELKKVMLFMEFMNETFDVELLLRFISNHGKESVATVPVIFTEDLALSNFPANKVSNGHLDMFKQIVYIYDKIGSRLHSLNTETIRFWRRLNYEQLNMIIDTLSKDNPKDLDEKLFNYRFSLSRLKKIVTPEEA